MFGGSLDQHLLTTSLSACALFAYILACTIRQNVALIDGKRSVAKAAVQATTTSMFTPVLTV